MVEAAGTERGAKKKPYPWGKIAPKARLDQLAKDAVRNDQALNTLDDDYKRCRRRLMAEKARIGRQQGEVESYLALREREDRRRKLNGVFERLTAEGVDVDFLTSEAFIAAAREAAGTVPSDTAAPVVPRGRKGNGAAPAGGVRAASNEAADHAGDDGLALQ